MENLVILGNFDGVHLGHKHLILSAVDYARKNKLKSIVYTFKTIKKNREYLLSCEEKEKILLELGVDEVFFDDFDRVKGYNAKEFVKKVLKDMLKASIVFCGYNYSFSYMKKANSETLKKLIKTVVVDEYRPKNEFVSSTKIRELLKQGDIDTAYRLLGRKLEYEGIVVKGRQLGRLIGFPTANILLKENRLKLKNGVYGSITKIENDDNSYLSVTNIGSNPTVSNTDDITIETHIFDFDKNIYGKKITVKIISMIREEKKFSSIEKLKEQIIKDSNEWKKRYARNKDK